LRLLADLIHWIDADNGVPISNKQTPAFDMRSKMGPKLSIFIGAPIEHESERAFLRSIVAHLEEAGARAVILANFHLPSRQVDFVVATDDAIAVIEVKATRLPIRGRENGDWGRMTASGDWVYYPNAYLQALAAKNSVRDAISVKWPVGTYYPNGYVIFTNTLPLGSDVTSGNFKVRVFTVDAFMGEFSALKGSPFTTLQIEDLARALGLRAATLDVALDEAGAWGTSQFLDAYRNAFLGEYSVDGDHWLPEDAEQLASLLAAARSGNGCFIRGPSGCGKTLAAKRVATELTREGAVCAFFAAKDIGGSWAVSLKREVSLLADQDQRALLRSIARSAIPAYFVLDGINELSPERAKEALRGLRALARRYEAKLIVTGQSAPPAELSGLKAISVSPPSMNLKQRIARGRNASLSPAVVDVLCGVTSGFEARIVGEIGDRLKTDNTRVGLIDQYMRERLGEHARDGSFGLRRLASAFHQQVVFSLSETAFDEFMRGQQVEFAACDAMFRAKVLTKRWGRISFSHEMFQNACAAHEHAKSIQDDPAGLGGSLNSPGLASIASDIMALIEGQSVCRAVLERLTNTSLICDADDGALGLEAAAAAKAMLSETHAELLTDIELTRLTIVSAKDAHYVTWEGNRDWSAEKQAQLAAIGIRASRGKELHGYFALCRAMDGRLFDERQRLLEVARLVQLPLKSNSFALAYYYGQGDRRHGFTTVVRSSFPGFSKKQRPSFAKLSLLALTSGGLHYVLEHCYSLLAPEDGEWLARELLAVLRQRWRDEPYHVHLAILNAVSFLRDAKQETRDELIEALNALDVHPSNWGTNSIMIDALKALGALDDEAESQRESIRAEFTSVLVAADNEETFDRALSLYTRRFDHPYDFIYGEEFHALPKDDQRRLLGCAFQAPELGNSMSLLWVAQEVAEYEDPADGRFFERFARLPSRTNPFFQFEMGAFILAVRFLGRHGLPLPATAPEGDVARCLCAIQSLVYAAEAKYDTAHHTVREAWQVLHSLQPRLVVGCLNDVVRPLLEPQFAEIARAYQPLDVLGRYTEDILTVCRKFAVAGLPPLSYAPAPDSANGIGFAFEILGSLGDRSDLDTLRLVGRDHSFARYAVSAMRSIEAAENSDP